jgi:hypothetical protein
LSENLAGVKRVIFQDFRFTETTAPETIIIHSKTRLLKIPSCPHILEGPEHSQHGHERLIASPRGHAIGEA